MFYCFSSFFAMERKGEGTKIINLLEKSWGQCNKNATQILAISSLLFGLNPGHINTTQDKKLRLFLAKWVVFHRNCALSHSILLLGVFGRGREFIICFTSWRWQQWQNSVDTHENLFISSLNTIYCWSSGESLGCYPCYWRHLNP